MTTKIQWDTSLRVGIDIIDDQHKILFDLANDLNNAFLNRATMQVVDTLCNVIMSYAFKHFATEEEFILEEKSRIDHCYQHYQLLRKFNDYRIEFRNNRQVEMPPGEFLKEWLLSHIVDKDIPALAGRIIDIKPPPGIDALESFDSSEIESDKRQQKRVHHNQILDEEIIGHCYNTNTMKTSVITIVDMAGGGLKISSERKCDIGDLLIISCNIGKNFRMKEKVRVKNCADDFYGVEFIAAKTETVAFLTQLSGATTQSYR